MATDSDMAELETYERLLQIVRKHFPTKRELTKDTVLQSLNYDGVDAMELVDEIAEVFPIDWSEFRYHDYFSDEGFLIGIDDKIELKIGELYNAILQGRWTTPVPDHRKRIKGSGIGGLVLFLAVVFLALVLWQQNGR